MRKDYNTGWGVYVASTGSVKFRMMTASSVETATAASAVTAGVWYNMAARYSGANLRLYINNELKAGATPQTGDCNISGSELVIGNQETLTGSYYLNADLGNIRIYSRSLSLTEIMRTTEQPLKEYCRGS